MEYIFEIDDSKFVVHVVRENVSKFYVVELDGNRVGHFHDTAFNRQDLRCWFGY